MTDIISVTLFALFYVIPLLVIRKYFKHLIWTRQINIAIGVIILESIVLFLTSLLFDQFEFTAEWSGFPLVLLYVNSQFLPILILGWILLLGVLYIVKGNKIL